MYDVSVFFSRLSFFTYTNNFSCHIGVVVVVVCYIQYFVSLLQPWYCCYIFFIDIFLFGGRWFYYHNKKPTNENDHKTQKPCNRIKKGIRSDRPKEEEEKNSRSYMCIMENVNRSHRLAGINLHVHHTLQHWLKHTIMI